MDESGTPESSATTVDQEAQGCRRCGACCIDADGRGLIGGDENTDARLRTPSGECRHLLPVNEEGERLCAVWGTAEQPQFCKLWPRRVAGIQPPECHAYHEPGVLAWALWVMSATIPDRAFACPHCTSRQTEPAQLAGSGSPADGNQSVAWHMECNHCGKVFIVSAQQWPGEGMRWNKH